MSCVTIRKVGNGYFISPGDWSEARHGSRANEDNFVAETREKCSEIVHQLLDGVKPGSSAPTQVDTAGRDDKTGGAPYGWCPTCLARGATRERRPNGNDTCVNGHIYKSSDAVGSLAPAVISAAAARNG